MPEKWKSLVYREKAGRRSPWTSNFYIGCANACTYCCCTFLLKQNWSSNVRLIKHFENEDHALQIFEEEVKQNLASLQARGRLFFSLTTDAMLPETKSLTYRAMKVCHDLDVPFKVLTKCTKWVDDEFFKEFTQHGTVWGQKPKMHLFAFGFSLTGQDAVEIGADSNQERIGALIKLKQMGFRTFISFEPVIDYNSTLKVFEQSHQHADFMRIGLLNGPTRDRNVDESRLRDFFDKILDLEKKTPIYWGDTIISHLGLERKDLPENCVEEEIF